MLHGLRYLADRPGKRTDRLKDFVENELHYLDFRETCLWYETVAAKFDDAERAFLGCNDRFFLLTALLGRNERAGDGNAARPWLFSRCREVEAEPDDHLDLWARYHFKDLDMKTQVLTTAGWKEHGDLRPGDYVFSPSGKPVKVIAARPFTDSACYRITFDNGIQFVCGAGHLWKVEVASRKRVPGSWKGTDAGSKRIGRETRIVETSELATLGGQFAPHVKATAPLLLEERRLPIDPYVFGVWLGDGDSSSGRVCGIDNEIFAEIESRGYRLSPSHCPKRAPFRASTVYGLGTHLRMLGVLGNKHIPLVYLLASQSQRLDLLCGIVDTDGNVSSVNGCVTVSMKRREFAEQVRTLANSLGYKARISPSRKTDSWHVVFQAGLDDQRPPCLLTRKRDLLRRKGPRLVGRAWRVVSVKRTKTVRTNCIQVDSPDGMYLAGRELIPTHNSTIGTFAGSIQEIVRDPEVTICILSCTRDIARAFLLQIQQEFESNEALKRLYSDVLWTDPKKESPRWSRDQGIVVKRKGNPKEGTVEAWGLIDGQPTSRHYRLLIYDDVVTQDLVGTPEMIKKVTERWELSDNLGTHGQTRKQHFGTRYSFADTYGTILERGTLKARVYPATDDGTLNGNPVLLTPERWAKVKDAQRSTVAAQMLLNPIAGNEAVFQAAWFKSYDVRPTILNVYIMCDPSQGRSTSSDRTAIAVVGVDVAGNRYLLDGVRHRMPLSERYGHLARFHKKWSGEIGIQSVQVGYEKYGMQNDLEVIEEWMERDKYQFPIAELAYPREGLHAKPHRVSRLEPDFRNGRFWLPAVVWHPHVADADGRRGVGGLAYWSIADEQDEQHRAGQIVYRPYHGPTKNQTAAESTSQGYRIVTPIKAIDEDRNVYDVTRALMEEALFFPFSPKDDLIDALSRLYDLEPKTAIQYEAGVLDPVEDSYGYDPRTVVSRSEPGSLEPIEDNG